MAAMHAASRSPTEADGLAHFDPLHVVAGGDHFTDHFMSGHKWVSGHAPIVVEHGQVGVAKTSIGDGDFHLLVAKRAGVKLIRLQGGVRGLGSVGFDGIAHWMVG